CGLLDADSDALKIKDRLKNNIRPSILGLFDIVNETKENKNIIKLIVASGSEKPYYIKKYGMTEKGCYIRMGAAAEPMPIKMIESLFAKRTRNSVRSIKANRQDLSFSQLKIYYEEIGLELGKQFAKNLELLTEEDKYNYVAYLLADENNTSIKVAKYEGIDRSNLIESNEYGYTSLIKATKQVIDKIAVENITKTKITSKEREQSQLWNPIALREAIINAFVHNDYTTEIPPKFEIFSDRIEITSYGGLMEGFSEKEFFEGFSAPRNKELMRVYKDLELVEQLGSGIPRILKYYDKSCFSFSDNFLRMTFKNSLFNGQSSGQSSGQEGGQEGGQVGSQVGSQVGDQVGGQSSSQKSKNVEDFVDLTKRQKEILQLIINNNRVTRDAISEKIHINTSAIQKHINVLKGIGYIERIGGNRGYWKVNLSRNE